MDLTELHIDELILDGFDPADKEGIDRAAQTEVARVLGITPPNLLSHRQAGQTSRHNAR